MHLFAHRPPQCPFAYPPTSVITKTCYSKTFNLCPPGQKRGNIGGAGRAQDGRLVRVGQAAQQQRQERAAAVLRRLPRSVEELRDASGQAGAWGGSMREWGWRLAGRGSRRRGSRGGRGVRGRKRRKQAPCRSTVEPGSWGGRGNTWGGPRAASSGLGAGRSTGAPQTDRTNKLGAGQGSGRTSPGLGAGKLRSKQSRAGAEQEKNRAGAE